jgi:hypothetical protein
MKVAQQIVGVNQRLGNSAVPNMQGTTRLIYDSVELTATTNQTINLFQGVSTRTFPNTNLNNNRFEVGESLAIQGVSFIMRPATITALSQLLTPTVGTASNFVSTLNLNFYIGNQRVIKDLDLNYSRSLIGESKRVTTINNVLHFETPIVIPPQIEFYATIRITSSTNTKADRFYLSLFGQGTLLNTKSTF